MLLTSKDNGRTIETRVGDSITIELAENPTTGYCWAHQADPEGITELRDSSFVMGETDRTVLGAPGVRHLDFRVTHRGTDRLELRYWQEWEGDSSIAETFSITIVARD